MKVYCKNRVIILSAIVVSCLLLFFSGCSNSGGDSSGGSNNDTTDPIIEDPIADDPIINDSEDYIWIFELDNRGDDGAPTSVYNFNLTTEEYYETDTSMCRIGCQGEINYWNATGEDSFYSGQDLEIRVSSTDSYTLLSGAVSYGECWGDYEKYSSDGQLLASGEFDCWENEGDDTDDELDSIQPDPILGGWQCASWTEGYSSYKSYFFIQFFDSGTFQTDPNNFDCTYYGNWSITGTTLTTAFSSASGSEYGCQNFSTISQSVSITELTESSLKWRYMLNGETHLTSCY